MGSYVYVDSREPEGLLVEIRKALGDRALIGLFETGDFALFDKCGCSIGIERKAISDFLTSFGSGRLGRQLSRLRQSYSPILLIEGWYALTAERKLKIGSHETGWSHGSVQMAMFALQSQGIRMLWTPNYAGTADLLRVLLDRSDRKCLREQVSWDDLYDVRQNGARHPGALWLEPGTASPSSVLQPHDSVALGARGGASTAGSRTIPARPATTTHRANLPKKPRRTATTKEAKPLELAPPERSDTV